MNINDVLFMFISLLVQRTEPAAKRRKKVQPITRRFTAGPPQADYPALLGCVKWQKQKIFLLSFVNKIHTSYVFC